MRLALFIMSIVSVALLFLLTQAASNTDFLHGTIPGSWG